MAGWPIWAAQVKQRIGVAVSHHFFYMKVISRRFSFVPETAAAAAPKPGRMRLHRKVYRLPVGKTKHQHLHVFFILNNNWDQLRFLK